MERGRQQQKPLYEGRAKGKRWRQTKAQDQQRDIWSTFGETESIIDAIELFLADVYEPEGCKGHGDRAVESVPSNRYAPGI